MGQLLPIDQRAHSSRVGAGNETPGPSLSRVGYRPIDANFGCLNLGNRAPSTALGETRNRLVLERLLAGLDPAGASEYAQALLSEFGSLTALMNAAPEAIDRAVPLLLGAGAAIAAARDFAEEALAPSPRGTPVHANDPALHRYLQSKLGRLPQEHLHVVFLDRDGGYIADEGIGSGGAGSLVAHLGGLFRRAMTLEAAAILLAHNHPSGVARPSARDIEETRRLSYVGQSLGIRLVDHLIITARAVCSMAQEGLA